jgi:hypothetical protein
MKITELRKLIQEVLDEVSIDEMARQAGSAAKFSINDAGKGALKQMKQTGEVPEGMKFSDIKVLKALFGSDSPMTQLEVANVVCDSNACQQAVNGNFRKLESLGFIDKIAYEKKGPSSGGAAGGGQKLDDLLADLDI